MPCYSNMRQDELNSMTMCSHQPDEFDMYFARAALAAEVESCQDARRGSLPGQTQTNTLAVEKKSPIPRRTASCKYPSRRRQGTPTRDCSRSPRRRSQDVSPSPTPSYAQESSLRAPSPRLDLKCHSAPHSRSSSWKKMKRPRSIKDFQEMHGDPVPRPRERTGSVPLEETISQKLQELKIIQADDMCVVRNFATSSRGLINRGDSFKRKSNQSIASDVGSCGSCPGDGRDRSRALSINSHGSGASSVGISPPVSKVLMLGDTGVGKTALLQQFMTSEYMGAIETSFDDECEKTVSVLLDGEETMLDFLDIRRDQDYKKHTNVEGYILTFSITERTSFQYIHDLVYEIRQEEGSAKAVILVANKTDLVRTRQVTEEEALDLCQTYDCKYVEVSAALNHKVDDLLVGIVKQIRLNPKREKKHRKLADQRQNSTTDSTAALGSPSTGRKDNGCVQTAKGILGKFFKKQSSTASVSKSCDNLMVL